MNTETYLMQAISRERERRAWNRQCLENHYLVFRSTLSAQLAKPENFAIAFGLGLGLGGYAKRSRKRGNQRPFSVRLCYALWVIMR